MWIVDEFVFGWRKCEDFMGGGGVFVYDFDFYVVDGVGIELVEGDGEFVVDDGVDVGVFKVVECEVGFGGCGVSGYDFYGIGVVRLEGWRKMLYGGRFVFVDGVVVVCVFMFGLFFFLLLGLCMFLVRVCWELVGKVFVVMMCV